MRSQTITRCVVLMAGAACVLLPDAIGCAQGESDIGGPGLLDLDAALEDAAPDPEAGTTSDATGGADDANDTNDAQRAGDADDTSDAQPTRDAPAGDAIATSDGAASDSSLSPDTSTPDAAPTGDSSTTAHDSSIDSPADVVDTGPPIDASCSSLTACGVQALCVSGECTPSRRVFVSTESFTGNLGGTSGADHSCQSLANAAELGGTWKAWVSDSTTSPSTRFVQASVGYRLLDGTFLATDWTDLVSGGLLHAIDLTEQRTSASSSNVWTGTLSSGVGIGGDVCGGFTSSANGATQSVVGNTARTDIGWSNATSEACDENNLRIYCMEQ